MSDPLQGAWPIIGKPMTADEQQDAAEAALREAVKPARLPPSKPPLLLLRPGLWTWLRALFVDHAVFRLFYNTRKPVAPGLYRSSHPLPYQLRAAQRLGIQSVLNLRGVEAHVASNQLEWDCCRRIGLRVLHFPLGSRAAPHRREVLDLIELFERLQKPLLIHCKSGADRAGFVSVLYLITQTDTPLEVAQRQLSFWRFGHVRQAKTGVLDLFFDAYRAHRDAHGTDFVDWVRNHYDRRALIESFRTGFWANQLVDRLLHRE